MEAQLPSWSDGHDLGGRCGVDIASRGGADNVVEGFDGGRLADSLSRGRVSSHKDLEDVCEGGENAMSKPSDVENVKQDNSQCPKALCAKTKTRHETRAATFMVKRKVGK